MQDLMLHIQPLRDHRLTQVRNLQGANALTGVVCLELLSDSRHKLVFIRQMVADQLRVLLKYA